MPVEARRHDAADAVEAGEHDAALARTGRGASELDLKGPEQSLKLRQRAVPQLATGDDLRRRFLLVFARPRRSGPFLGPVCDHRQGKGCRRRLKRKSGEKGTKSIAGAGRKERTLAARAGDGRMQRLQAKAYPPASLWACACAMCREISPAG
jgi:hypothetical protein